MSPHFQRWTEREVRHNWDFLTSGLAETNRLYDEQQNPAGIQSVNQGQILLHLTNYFVPLTKLSVLYDEVNPILPTQNELSWDLLKKWSKRIVFESLVNGLFIQLLNMWKITYYIFYRVVSLSLSNKIGMDEIWHTAGSSPRCHWNRINKNYRNALNFKITISMFLQERKKNIAHSTGNQISFILNDERRS